MERKKGTIIKVVPIVLILLGAVIFFLWNSNYDYCHNQEILSLLKNDGCTPECVIGGDYYALPCKLEDFIKNGWFLQTNTENNQITLPGKSQATVYMPHGCFMFVINNFEKEIAIEDAVVVELISEVQKQADPDYNQEYFVTEKGITAITRRGTILRLCKKIDYFYPGANAWGAQSDDHFCSKETQEALITISYYTDKDRCHRISIIADKKAAEIAGIDLYFSQYNIVKDRFYLEREAQ